MESTQFNHLKYYLQHQEAPPILDKEERQQLQKESKKYVYKDGILYKKKENNEERLLHVIQWHEIEPVLFLTHSHSLGGHFNSDTMLAKIRETYFWPQMRDDIRMYVQTCDQCQ